MLQCKAKRQYLLTCKVIRYCISALQNSIDKNCVQNKMFGNDVSNHVNSLGYKRVYLALYKVADTSFHIQGNDLHSLAPISGLVIPFIRDQQVVFQFYKRVENVRAQWDIDVFRKELGWIRPVLTPIGVITCSYSSRHCGSKFTKKIMYLWLHSSYI